MRAPTLAALALLCSCAPPLAETVADPLIEDHGAGDAALLAVQAFMQPADYATPERFFDRLEGLFATAADEALLDERTVVVLPEYLGTWLVALDEGPGMFEKETVSEAMTDLALGHLLPFLGSSWTASVEDGDAFAAFTVKSERMAEVYDDVIARLAERHGVTVVGGSILLPQPRIEDGRLVVTPGDPIENVSVVYGPDGTRLGIARKRFPTADEQGFVTPGSGGIVVDTPAGRVGVLVCADSWFPESYAMLAEERAIAVAVPTFHSHDGIWDEPWGGYSGQTAPDDVDEGDIGVLSEAEAWARYSLPTRAKALGMVGVTAPLRGALWDLGDDGNALLVGKDATTNATRVDGPGLFRLRFDGAR